MELLDYYVRLRVYLDCVFGPAVRIFTEPDHAAQMQLYDGAKFDVLCCMFLVNLFFPSQRCSSVIYMKLSVHLFDSQEPFNEVLH
jgi:hypothetical protein